MAEDWRVTVEVENGSGQGLGAKLDEHEIEDETRERLGDAIAVSADGPRLFLYADTREAAEQARDLVRSILDKEQQLSATFALDRWHPLADEWRPGDEPLPDTEAEREAELDEAEAQDAADSAASGYAEWEVRIDLPGHSDAVDLAERLEGEGFPVTRRWKHLIVGAADEEDANELAERLRTEAPAAATLTVEPSGEMAWEAAPKRSKWYFIVPNM
jgi:hypothetical protein